FTIEKKRINVNVKIYSSIIILIIKEITQIANFKCQYPDRSSDDFFANGWFKTHGIKPYWWAVLFFGLAISVYHIIISFGRFQSEYHKYDTIVDFGLALLWLSAALTNIYPAYVGFIISCRPTDQSGNPYSAAIMGWCHGYVTSVAFSWIITIVYSIMAIISRRLWKLSVDEDFGAPMTNISRRELEDFHSPPSHGFTEFRRDSRGVNLNPGPSTSYHTPGNSDTYYGATIPHNYYSNNN
ncbi:22025_t:CDS:2, partial [Dentiscutata erythropus]